MQQVREPQKDGETEEGFLKREEAHWEAVRKNEEKLLAARERHEKRMGR